MCVFLLNRKCIRVCGCHTSCTVQSVLCWCARAILRGPGMGSLRVYSRLAHMRPYIHLLVVTCLTRFYFQCLQVTYYSLRGYWCVTKDKSSQNLGNIKHWKFKWAKHFTVSVQIVREHGAQCLMMACVCVRVCGTLATLTVLINSDRSTWCMCVSLSLCGSGWGWGVIV